MTEQMTLDLTDKGSHQEAVTARLLRATRERPLTVAQLQAEPTVYGTSASRFLRWSVERLRQRGVVVTTVMRKARDSRGRTIQYGEWWCEA